MHLRDKYRFVDLLDSADCDWLVGTLAFERNGQDIPTQEHICEIIQSYKDSGYDWGTYDIVSALRQEGYAVDCVFGETSYRF